MFVRARVGTDVYRILGDSVLEVTTTKIVLGNKLFLARGRKVWFNLADFVELSNGGF